VHNIPKSTALAMESKVEDWPQSPEARPIIQPNPVPKVDEACPSTTVASPPRGMDGNTADQNLPFFTKDFVKLYPLQANAATHLATHPYIHPPSYDCIIAEYNSILQAYTDRKITTNDIVVFHHAAFSGHYPDILYTQLNIQAPEYIEDNRVISELLDKYPSGINTALLGLHVWNEKAIFRRHQGKKRKHEYATVPLSKIINDATAHLVILRCPNGLATYLTGRPVSNVETRTSDTGLYCTGIDTSYPGAILVDVSFYSAYHFYSLTMPRKQAKNLALASTGTRRFPNTPSHYKFGLHEVITPNLRTKFRKHTFGSARSKSFAARCAIPAEYADQQTATRVRRIELLKALRAQDEFLVTQHTNDIHVRMSNTTHLAYIHIALKNNRPDDATDHLKVLYPLDDEDIISRTRVRWEHLGWILKRIEIRDSIDAVTCLLTGCSGGGLHHLAGLTLAALSSKHQATVIYTLIERGVGCHGLKYFTKLTKSIHNVARRTQDLPSPIRDLPIPAWLDDGNRTLSSINPEPYDLMYLNLLCGRAQDDLIAQEDGYVEKRSGAPRPHTLVTDHPQTKDQQQTYWRDQVNLSWDRIASHIEPTIAKRKDTTPSELHAHTISMAPRGSINQGKYDFSEYDIATQNLHKREWLNRMPTSFFIDCLAKPAVMFTNAQSKIEAGLRLRQIIPGPIYHWFMESQIMFYFERSIYKSDEYFSLESDPTEIIKDHEETRLRAGKGEVTLASDYADFNFLHTIYDMSQFWLRCFRAPAERHAGPGPWGGTNYAGHIVNLCDWLVEALDNMYVREVADDGKFHRVLQGLWSGWRTTSSINNGANKGYRDALCHTYERHMGYNPMVKGRGNGDDGNYKMRSLADSMFYLRHMTLADLDVQASKQLVSYDVAEYLRIWYANGKIRGSLIRSLASFVSSDLQAPTIIPGRDYATGTSSAIDMMVRRGFDVTEGEALRDYLCLAWSVVKWTTPDGEQHSTKLHDPRKLYAPVEQGGFGLYRSPDLPRYRLASSKAWRIPRVTWELDGVPHHGAQAMFQDIWSRFTRNGIDTAPLNRVYDDIVSAMTMGVDLKLNRGQLNLVEGHLAKHIDWLNKIDVVEAPKTPYPPVYIAECVRSYFSEYIDQVTHLAKPVILPIIAEEKAKAVARALGLASISPRLVHELRDAETGAGIPITHILRSEEETPTPMLRLLAFYPEYLVRLCFDTNYEPPLNVSAVIPADYLPVAHYTLGRCIRKFATDQGDQNLNRIMIDEITEQVNTILIDYYRKELSAIYQF